MSQEFAVMNFLKSANRGSPLLWRSSLVMLFGLAVCVAMSILDNSLIAGVSVWDKPAKFFFSLIVHSITIAWAISLLAKPARGVRTAEILFVAAAWFEMAYMIFRASRGEASHFNTSTLFAGIMYSLMGVGALTLTITSAFIGWRVWQQRHLGLVLEAAAIGLVLGAVLGTIAGATLSSHTNHWIGGDQTDATGLGFFLWSTTGGDLRVAHFIGLHATQLVPLAALSGKRSVVIGVAFACVLITLAAFIQALQGVPVLQS